MTKSLTAGTQPKRKKITPDSALGEDPGQFGMTKRVEFDVDLTIQVPGNMSELVKGFQYL
ncbi:hypothetical protein BpHYR1_005664 [Brachionus plicatilis]|uniref:Uncharacterized protein n=1 Tax=Brachionus plicatilis TaxID=10195 RepID=A0A3M7Q114_BRAPC|nr:hypothetical protein BpHYR1_005664 [Brachionus plicatilis]